MKFAPSNMLREKVEICEEGGRQSPPGVCEGMKGNVQVS